MLLPLKLRPDWLSTLIHLLLWLTWLPNGRSQSLFEYFPSSPKSSSAVLKRTLSNEDFIHSKVKILPDDQDVVFQLRYGQKIKLVYPISVKGPISIAVSPCAGALKWTLVWRPHTMETFDVMQADGASTGVGHDPLDLHNQKPSNVSLSPKKSSYSSRRRRRKAGRGYGTKVLSSNFSIQLTKNPKMRYVFSMSRAILQIELSSGAGKDPWHFEKDSTQPGLYVVEIESVSQQAKFHALASRHPMLQEDIESSLKALKPKTPSVKHSITLSWTTSSHDAKLFCLTVSQHRLYSSLCGARELQRQWRTHTDTSADSSMILGCTSNNFYDFPATPHAKYFVTVWKDSSLIPLVQATVKSRPHRRIPRLKPGVMMPFTLAAGGEAVAKFNVRKSGKKLHVGAVSCSGGIRVQVLAGKERVASARGREALHLSIRRPPKAKLTIKVSPEPPLESLYRVQLVVTHSSRRLPIPRLPKSVSVYSSPINCTAATVQWTRAPGGPSYCVIFQRHPSGRPPEIRPPIQCGWEQVIKRPDYFEVTECFNSTKTLQNLQQRTITKLRPESSFLVNVLIRHPITGRTLALAPSMLSLPAC